MQRRVSLISSKQNERNVSRRQYTGLAAIYLGGVLLANIWWPLFMLPIAMLQLYMLVIRREEAYLTRAFGDRYLDYQRRVRRWL